MGQNKTFLITENVRQNINSVFYSRYSYSYLLVNNETWLRTTYYKQQRGSPWINNFAEAKRWHSLTLQSLNLDNIEWPTQNGCLENFLTLK